MNGDYLSSNAAKMISRRKPRNGDGGLKMPNNERSAEYWRGVLETAKQAGYSKLAIYGYEQLLATAEAREATQPTALPSVAMGGTVMAGNKTDSPTAAEVTKALEKAHWIGCSPHEWPTVDDIPLLCHALIAEHSRATTAAEVVEACRVALEEIRAAVTTSTGQCGVLGTNWAECDYCGAVSTARKEPIPHEKGCAFAVSTASLALCARWKEANGGK